MVATTINIEDISIVHLVSNIGIRIFAGSALDVLDRYYQAAKLIHPEYVIRITADCPLFDYKILDDAIEKLKPETDYLAALSETLADGLDFEIIRFKTLTQAWKHARLASEREHVTLYIKIIKNYFKFKIMKALLGIYIKNVGRLMSLKIIYLSKIFLNTLKATEKNILILKIY